MASATEPIVPLPLLLPSLVARLAAILPPDAPGEMLGDLENKSQKRGLSEKSTVVVQRFNDFPRGDVDVYERPAMGWSHLPPARLIASAKHILAHGLFRAPSGDVQVALSERTVADLFELATRTPTCPLLHDASIRTQIIDQALSVISTPPMTPASKKPSVWHALLSRLRGQAVAAWSQVLARLSNSDELFSSRVVPLASAPESALALACVCLRLVPQTADVGNDTLPLLLLQALGKTEEHKSAVLLALSHVLQRALTGGSDRAHARALQACEIFEKSKDANAKNAALRLQCVLLAKRPDAQFDKFLAKRVTRPLVHGADSAKTARALELSCVAVSVRPAVALPVVIDALKKAKCLRGEASASGDAVELRLALLAEAMAKADPSSLGIFLEVGDGSDTLECSKRTLTGLCALRALLENGQSRFAALAGSLLPGLLAELDKDPPTSRETMTVAPPGYVDEVRLRLGQDGEDILPRYTSLDEEDIKARNRLVVGVEAIRTLALLSCMPSDSKLSLPMASSLYPSPRFLEARHHPCIRAACLAAMKRVVRTAVGDSHRLAVIDQLREACVASMSHVDDLAAVLGSVGDASGLGKKQQDAFESLVLALAGAGQSTCDALASAVECLFPSSQLCAMMRTERNAVALALSPSVAGLAKSTCAILDAWTCNNPALAMSPRCTAVRCALCHGTAPACLEQMWDAALKLLPGERDKATVLCDVASAAGHDGETAANVLRRVVGWWKKHAEVSQPLVASKPKSSFFMRRDPGLVTPSPVVPPAVVLDPERSWVACRVIRRLAEGSSLRDGIDKHATGSDVLKSLRAGVMSTVASCTDAADAANEGCIAVQLLSAAVTQWAGIGDVLGQQERGDIVWGRAERRGVWLWLRKLYAKHAKLRTVVTSTAVALLNVGPVSLGSLADAMDPALWAWARSSYAFCVALLTAHWTTYLPVYLASLFDPADLSEWRMVFESVRAASKAWVPSGPMPDIKSSAGVVAASLVALANGYGHLDLLCCGLMRTGQDYSKCMVELLAFTKGGAKIDANHLASFARQLRRDLCRPVFDMLASISRFDCAVALATDFTDFDHLLKLNVPASVWAAVNEREGCLAFLVERLDGGIDVSAALAAVIASADPAVIARTLVEALDANKLQSKGAAARCLAPRVADVCEACLPAQFATLACFAYGCHVVDLEEGLKAWAAIKRGQVLSLEGIDAIADVCSPERTRMWCATALLWACSAVDVSVRTNCVEAYSALRHRAGSIDWPNGARGETAALVQLPRRMGAKGIQALACTIGVTESDALQVGSNALAGALSELWSSALLIDETLELAAIEVLCRCPARPSKAKQLFWAGFQRVMRAAMSASDLARVTHVCTLVAEQLSGEEKAGLKALNGGDISAQCGETALLVILDLALEANKTHWVIKVLRAGGPRVALRAAQLLMSPPPGMSGVVEAAAALLAGTLPAATESGASLFVALVEENEALDKAQRAWTVVALEQQEAPRFVTKRRARQAPARDQVSESMLRPRSSILEIIAPNAKDAELGERLVAHAVDVGVDPAWVRFWMDPSVVRARALGLTAVDEDLTNTASKIIEEELWPSFTRSRWWLFEEE